MRGGGTLWYLSELLNIERYVSVSHEKKASGLDEGLLDLMILNFFLKENNKFLFAFKNRKKQ